MTIKVQDYKELPRKKKKKMKKKLREIAMLWIEIRNHKGMLFTSSDKTYEQ